MALECVTVNTRPDLDEEAGAAFRERWPEFIFHDPISRAYVDRAEQYFPEFQVFLLDDGRVAAGGWGVPFAYDGDTAGLPDGYDGTLVRATTATRRAPPRRRSASWPPPSTVTTTNADSRRKCSGSSPPEPATPG